jgi:hypothetical protein
VTNFGEVLTNQNNWSIGNIQDRQSIKHRIQNYKPIHQWIIFYFHENDEDIEEFMKGNLQILHKDGDETDPNRYVIYTHEDQDDSKPYTNYFWTLHFGTQKENSQDMVHAQKRRKLN